MRDNTSGEWFERLLRAARADGGRQNPPGGEIEPDSHPFTTEELEDLLHGATLERYTPGTGIHRRNVMAVFDTADGAEYDVLGITFRKGASDWPEKLIGQRLASIDEVGEVAVIEFEEAKACIRVRDTVAFGVYEIPRRSEDADE